MINYSSFLIRFQTQPRFRMNRNTYTDHKITDIEHPEFHNTCSVGSCGKQFQDATSLFNHQLANKHFHLYCVLCQRSYSARDKMNRHVNSVHSKSQEFKCMFCDKVYCRSDVLTAHQLEKHGMVSCRTCNSAFPTKELLHQHKQTAHPSYGSVASGW